MIFVHSSFRTGSTYLWSKLRKSSSTLTYYEVFHELLGSIRPEDINLWGPDGWNSNHPSGAPYFLEFLPLLRPEGGVEGFAPAVSYEGFIPVQGCLGPISSTEAAYVERLVKHAEDRGRIPVLTETRSLGRLRGLKKAAPGLHILLYRNLFQQWCSITQQVLGGNPYFLDSVIEIVRLNGHDPILDALQRLFPLAGASVNRPETFAVFALLHLHLYVQAAGAADLVVDLNRLESDPAHRETVERVFAGQAINVSLSDVKNTIAYSVCPLGSGRDVQERLKVLGDMILDLAPDAYGRAFGETVLSDLIEEYDRHEFHAAGLRKTLIQSQELIASRDHLPHQLALVSAERDALRQQYDDERLAAAHFQNVHDAGLVESAQVRRQLDDALAACAMLAGERDAALRDQEVVRLERDVATAAHDRLCLERDDLLAQYQTERDERAAAEAALAALATRLEAVQADHDATARMLEQLQAARDDLLAQHRTERNDRAEAQTRHEALVARLEAAVADHDASALVLREQAQAAYAGLRAECDQTLAAARQASRERDEQQALNRKLSNALAALLDSREQQQEWTGQLTKRIGQLEQEIGLLAVGWITTGQDQAGGTVPERVIPMLGQRSARRRTIDHWLRTGDAARDAQDWAGAANAYRFYLGLKPEDHAIWVQYGHALKEAGVLAGALSAYEESRKLQPIDSDRDLHLLHLQQRLTIDAPNALPLPGELESLKPNPLLLVTTTVAAWVLETESGKAYCIHRGSGVYYGISFSEDTLFIACRQAAVGADRNTQDNVILCFDRNLVQREVLRAPWPIRDVHQIYYHQGTLYVCSTYDDAVLEYDLALHRWRRWHPFGGPEEAPDQHHINSILVDADGILLAGNAPEGWFARFGPDRVYRGENRKPIGFGTHNVWREQGKATVCSSNEGGIRSEDNRFRLVCENGWVRGVASVGRDRYIGVSQNLVREAREQSDCAVLLVDQSGAVSRCYTFENYGMLHDIRLLGGADPTHNGVEFQLTPGALHQVDSVYQTRPDMVAL